MCDSSVIAALFSGAQSDSEVTEGGGSSAVSDRGYTSDSELYESSSRQLHQHRASPELALRPVPDNGSWLLVGLLHFALVVVFFP